MSRAGSWGWERRRLAVLIPAFNDQRGLEKALASLSQDGSWFDVFVVDDGSDPPVRIPPGLPYQVHLVRQEPNRGISAALNTGLARIAEAGYAYIARLDAGDLSLPGRFVAQLAFLDDHPDHAVVGTATRYADPNSDLHFDFYPPADHKALARFYRYRSGLVHPSVMIRMSCLRTCGFYRDKFRGGEDYDLFMRLADKHKLANLKSIFVIKELSSRSITASRQPLVMSRIKLLAHHFNPWTVHSYLGLMSNALLLLAARPLVLKLRSLGTEFRDRKGRPA